MSAAAILTLMETIINGAGTDDNWTQGACARKVDDTPCSPLHPDAVKFDLTGALILANQQWNVGENNSPPTYEFFHEAYAIIQAFAFDPPIPFEHPQSQYNRDIEAWNDSESASNISAIVASL